MLQAYASGNIWYAQESIKRTLYVFSNSLRERYVSNGIYYDYDDCYICCYCSSVVCGDV